jgi:hypothetical protein
LAAKFTEADRHLRRLGKVASLEAQGCASLPGRAPLKT